MNSNPKSIAFIAILGSLLFPSIGDTREPFRTSCSPSIALHQSQFQRDYQPRHQIPHKAPTLRGCGCHGGVAIQLIAGHQRGKTKRPQGWHAREWFERRGYNLDNYAHRHRDGTVHYGRNMLR